jgi:hypothetical protein
MSWRPATTALFVRMMPVRLTQVANKLITKICLETRKPDKCTLLLPIQLVNRNNPFRRNFHLLFNLTLGY